MEFWNWEGRPAVVMPDGRAFASLGNADFTPDGVWTEVDSDEVLDSGRLVDRATFGSMFRKELIAARGVDTIPWKDASASAKAAE